MSTDPHEKTDRQATLSEYICPASTGQTGSHDYKPGNGFVFCRNCGCTMAVVSVGYREAPSIDVNDVTCGSTAHQVVADKGSATI